MKSFIIKLFLTLTLIFPFILNSQIEYPKDYFSKPVEIPLVLSGNFGESRSNHFHSGLDFKTQNKEGLRIISSAKGYVSRIKIAHGGFGKALYINHPNGFTTVYAHLKKFNKEIEDYIKKIQYDRKSYEIDLYLKKNQITIDKNQFIAFSGNTGSSTGPHLHYEIRKSSNQKPLNPILFGMHVNDSRRPELKSVYSYNNVDINNYKSLKPIKLFLKKINDSIFKTPEIYLKGNSGFGINVYDRQDSANNKNGVYNISTYYNNEFINSIKYNSFLFEESILINTLIDFEHYIKNKERVIKLFKTSGNKLSLYENENNGLINIKPNNSEFKIKISDIEENNIFIIIPINSNKMEIINKKDENLNLTINNKKINNDLNYNFIYGNQKINIPKNTFLQNVDLYVDFSKDSLKIINPNVPVFKNIKIIFPNSNSKKGNYLANISKYKQETFVTSNLNVNNNFETKTKKLGTFFIKNDSIPPKIKSLNFNNEEWISNKKYLRIKISDQETGIKKYNGTINGSWVLFEYEYKKNEIFYEFDKYYNKKAKNELEVTVEDMVGNISIFKSVFYRKFN
ncbi:MAG: peptidase M23 [Flavobacteriaceae bacterium]|nr:peptidase M23 [Flavobacteriaceae bacterium]|tara:strand:- start:4474 stop:6177 length:1704 start_codon:yes stop_codon:yes gene_type:complete